MEWLDNLLFNPDSIAHIVLLYSLVISIGVLLGRIRIFGVSLGVTFILFVGILMGHFGFSGNLQIINFVQDFGLILFVYCIGLQVGPSFFSSFKKGGVSMNLMAAGAILLNIAVMAVLWLLLFEKEDLPMMVGVLCGAVTNTPGLGAANEALGQLGYSGPQIANGYACAYPLAVVGIIGATILIKYLCRVNLAAEKDALAREETADRHEKPHRMYVEVKNPALEDITLKSLREMANRDFVCSRILHDGNESLPNRDTVLHQGDHLLIVCASDEADAIVTFIGSQVKADKEFDPGHSPLVSKRILVTEEDVNGKTLSQLSLSGKFGVNATRIYRAGVELLARPDQRLQVGDRIRVVGPSDAVDRLAARLGNSHNQLDHPNILTIFVGIFIGILFGSLPIAIPGMPTPVKLGLAGGPLIISILISRFGYRMKLVTYTTVSANLMLREIGLALFLASVGIKAGGNFISTVVEGDGLLYVLCGFLITVIPILCIGPVARYRYKMNYFTLMGMIAGTYTDPPALAYANQTAGNDAPALGYTTVYPLAMFLRIITAQVLILILG
ncbi:MAG: putative transporter [Bacteroidales bacterium]|nr:putative transporter [Bacteroidales bacterium]